MCLEICLALVSKRSTREQKKRRCSFMATDTSDLKTWHVTAIAYVNVEATSEKEAKQKAYDAFDCCNRLNQQICKIH